MHCISSKIYRNKPPKNGNNIYRLRSSKSHPLIIKKHDLRSVFLNQQNMGITKLNPRALQKLGFEKLFF